MLASTTRFKILWRPSTLQLLVLKLSKTNRIKTKSRCRLKQIRILWLQTANKTVTNHLTLLVGRKPPICSHSLWSPWKASPTLKWADIGLQADPASASSRMPAQISLSSNLALFEKMSLKTSRRFGSSAQKFTVQLICVISRLQSLFCAIRVMRSGEWYKWNSSIRCLSMLASLLLRLMLRMADINFSSSMVLTNKSMCLISTHWGSRVR